MKRAPVPVEKGFRVRLMSPLGSYPADSFIAPSAAIVTSPEICFSVVRVRMTWGFSEVDDLDPIEIPLLGSIILSGEGGDPAIYPYPAYQRVLLESDTDEELAHSSRLPNSRKMERQSRKQFLNEPKCFEKGLRKEASKERFSANGEQIIRNTSKGRFVVFWKSTAYSPYFVGGHRRMLATRSNR